LRAQLAEMEKQCVEVEKFAKEAERSRNAENMQEELATRKQVGWWLKAMTATQMQFYGFKTFDYDEKAEQIQLTLQVDNVGDVPVLIQLRNHNFDNAKVRYRYRSLTKLSYKGLQVDRVVAETKKHGGDVPFFLESLKKEFSPKPR
jgi:hypothetical protein